MGGARLDCGRSSLSDCQLLSAAIPSSVSESAMTNKTNLDRLVAIANEASQAGRWKARREGLLYRGAPSEVRSLKDDDEARARAEAAMERALSKASGKR